MSDWEKEIDDFLAPHGVAFSEQTWQDFREEMRDKIKANRLSFFTNILLRDDIGSFMYRMESFVTSIIVLPALYFHKLTSRGAILLAILSLIFCIPGFWMWSYYLMPQEKRREAMRALFERKSGKFYYDSPTS